MAHNVDQHKKTHYSYFVIVNKLLNCIFLHTLINAIWGPAFLTMLAVPLITMVVVVTLQVVFRHNSILAELAMYENTVMNYRKLIFVPTFMAIIPLVIT